MSSVSFFRCVKDTLFFRGGCMYFIVLCVTLMQIVFTLFSIDFILLICKLLHNKFIAYFFNLYKKPTA